jgi:hypothetical protein
MKDSCTAVSSASGAAAMPWRRPSSQRSRVPHSSPSRPPFSFVSRSEHYLPLHQGQQSSQEPETGPRSVTDWCFGSMGDFFADLLPKEVPQNSSQQPPTFEDDVLVSPKAGSESAATRSSNTPTMAVHPMVSTSSCLDALIAPPDTPAPDPIHQCPRLCPCSARTPPRTWRAPCSRCSRSSAAACKRSWRTLTGAAAAAGCGAAVRTCVACLPTCVSPPLGQPLDPSLWLALQAAGGFGEPHRAGCPGCYRPPVCSGAAGGCLQGALGRAGEDAEGGAPLSADHQGQAGAGRGHR